MGRSRAGPDPTDTVNHDVYLAVAFLTHAAIGYAVVSGLTEFPPAAGAVGALVPDLDLYLGPVLGLPVVHRGALHTPLALLGLMGAVFLAGRLLAGPPRTGSPVDVDARGVAVGVGAGFLTHLLIDTSTSAGIMWLYPASTASLSLGVPIHGAAGTAALWLVALSLVRFGPRLRDGVTADR